MLSVLIVLVALWLSFNSLFLAAAVLSSRRMEREAAADRPVDVVPVLPLPAL
ncbi:hypothetical protein [Patulibacter sp. SYSU D01012]|uniref:hypothetical protein n=1 Tax=Patulibacter sp. SYSU D01012 TaxID=2817381 RepID=UPI001B308BC0|nr:hypothetical protein [Patulibacter sp. SYSU D01012]